jgi:hypothetical protein
VTHSARQAISAGEAPLARDLMSTLDLYGPTALILAFADDPVLVAAPSTASVSAGHGAGPQGPGGSGGLATSVGGPGGGGGSSLSSFAILLALIGLAASPFLGRLLTAPVEWRPVPFVSLLERPG